MPSKAYTNFQKNLDTVNRLILTFEDAKRARNSKGRGAFDHITRSAVVFLISAFEVYCEEILAEGCHHIIRNAGDAENLPNSVKNTINSHVRNESNHVTPLMLADEGWREIYRRIVENKVNWLNSPNTKNLKTLFEQLLGISMTEIEKTRYFDQLDHIVAFRGEITHRVRANSYVHIEDVKKYKQQIEELTQSLDILVKNHIKTFYAVKAPWNETYKS